MGERGSFVAGWMCSLNWAMTGIVDITAVALYMKYWTAFADVPQWAFALVTPALVGALNMVAVRWFGEIEFRFSIVEVGVLVLFLLLGAVLLVSGHGVGGHAPGLHLIAENGGLFPHGLLPAIVVIQGVVFAYSGIELIGTAAGEAENAETVLPHAVSSVMWRISVFCVGRWWCWSGCCPGPPTGPGSAFS